MRYKPCPIEMVVMTHGANEAYMKEIVPLLVKAGVNPPEKHHWIGGSVLKRKLMNTSK